jgi:bifunctional DNA-binding transcriptional regulator/antitoxin component of YhaV-PrlF toxin-antitoxin module
MPLPFGPSRISSNRQVALPKELMQHSSLEPGDQVYFVPNDDVSASVLLIPAEVMSRWTEDSLKSARAKTHSPIARVRADGDTTS